MFGAMLESYHKLQLKPKTIPELKGTQWLNSLHYHRKPLTMPKRLPQATAGMCVSQHYQWTF